VHFQSQAHILIGLLHPFHWRVTRKVSFQLMSRLVRLYLNRSLKREDISSYQSLVLMLLETLRPKRLIFMSMLNDQLLLHNLLTDLLYKLAMLLMKPNRSYV